MDSSVQNRPESENPHHHHRAEQQNEINHNNHKKTKLNTSDVSTAPLLPSAASSPSHEFSFTISLHHHSTAAITTTSSLLPGPAASVLDKNISASNKTLTNPFAIDLSPADEIFFHGHLLPLHLLSHLQQTATSPRSSTNSLDSFTLPIKELMLDEQKHQPPHEEQEIRLPRQSSRVAASSKSDSKIARKSKSFSRFGWRKVVSEVRGRKEASADAVGNPPEANTSKNKSKKKQSKRNMVLDDVSQLLKRYIRMVRPLLFFKKNANREENRGGEVDGDGDVELDFSGQQQHRSFSGNLSARRTNKNDFHVRSGRGASELFSSAPASMRTSPSNSGVLVPTPMAAGSMRNNDSSTMEELQAAIQAAIAHCKNSIAAAEEGKAVVKA